MKANLGTVEDALYRGPNATEEVQAIRREVDRITLGAARTVPGERSPRELRFDRILVGWDGSSHAETALDWALALGRVYDASIDLASVIPLHGPREIYTASGLAGKEEQDAQVELRNPLHRAERRHLPTRTHLLHGSPVAELAKAADRLRSSLIVIGSRGRSRIADIALGGTALALVNASPVSILVARSSPPPRSVLVPTDGSVPSQEAAFIASDLGRAWHVPGTLLHVVAPPSFGSPEAARRSFNRLFADFGRNPAFGTKLKMDIQFGPPARRIAEAAHAGDLIVMGSRGLSGLRSLVAGSVSSAVLSSARTASVLLVKDPL